MFRVLAFVLAVALCGGFLISSYTAITDTAGDMTFTENVRFGDPSVLDGRRVQFDYQCGDHMLWAVDYRFGPEDRHSVEFTFDQHPVVSRPRETRESLTVYTHSGIDMSMSGGNGFQPGHSGYGEMLRAVAARTPDGGEFEMNLKLKDYLDYHQFNFELDYTSDKYVCHEHVDMMILLDEENTYGDSPCYEDFSQLFRFPVMDSQIVSIKVQKGPDGKIWRIYFNTEDQTSVNVYNTATDEGLYCIPVYRGAPDSEEMLPGEYAQGMGVYFIPWKPYDDGYTYANSRQRVTLDVEQAQNILPLPEDTAVYGMQLDEETGNVWVLTLEDGIYALNRITPEGGSIRLELMTLQSDQDFQSPTWYRNNGLTLIYANRQIALVSEGEVPKLELNVPVGEAFEGFYSFRRETGAMLWADGVLYLMDHPHFRNFLNVMAFDPTGLLYWGEYQCSMLPEDVYGTYPYVEARYQPAVIE
ncbi:MAG: hypothetical protein IJ960_06245 [Oscillospiraceae bacterium]|nr:hypothetical protein [Oscillospiraceae bacterium]